MSVAAGVCGPADADLVAALVAADVPAGRAVTFVAAGLAVYVGGHVVVVEEVTEPLSGDRRVLVAAGAEPLLANVDLMGELRRHVAREYPSASTVVLRSRGDVEPEQAIGARLLMRYVEFSSPPEAQPEAPGWTVAPFTKTEREAVAALLTQAINAGYTSVGTAAAERETRHLVDDLLDRAGDEVTIFCAFRRGDFAGHATVVWDEDDLTGEVRAELFDLFVRPEHRGTPAARLLTSAAVRSAAAAGFRLRGHVVGGDDNARVVFERLIADGWHPAEAYWSVTARRSPEEVG
jgi:GNAT superfamily N-acetyltransferase